MPATTDIVIVGGGIIGLLTARELSHAGRQVTIVERGQPGREASRAAAGILSQLPPWQSPPALLALNQWSRRRYPSLVDEVQRQSHLPAGLDACGVFYLLCEDGKELAVAEQWAREQAEPFDYLSAASMRRHEPALRAPFGAVCLSAIARLSTAHFLRALLEDVLKAGVQVVADTLVETLLQDNGCIGGVRTQQGTITAQHTVLATGAWSDSLLAQLGMAGWIQPVRGQVIQYAAPPGLLNRVALGEQGYAVPGLRGAILVGSTKERVGFDKSTTGAAREELQARAVRLLPILGDMPITRQWANLRPESADGLPLIGPVSAWPGLWLNTGHFTDGINTAPASTRLLADLLLDRTTALDSSAYAPDRLQETGRPE